MFDKRLVFLSLILSIQQVKSCRKNSGPIVNRKDLVDCTKIFTNRTVSFESGLYPGQWMYPSSNKYFPRIYRASTALVKKDTTYHWFLHDCKVTGKVCLEPKRSGWEDYFYARYPVPGRLTLDTNLYEGSNEDKGIEIWCTSCTPERDDLTYSDCQLVTWIPFHSEKQMLGLLTPDLAVMRGKYGDSDWFKWRILSPPTKQYWEIVAVSNNCGGLVDKPASVIITSSLKKTTSTTQTLDVSAKLSLGRSAIQALQVLSGEAGISYSWSSTSTTEAAEGLTFTAGGGVPGKVVEPGYKWIVKRLVGEADYIQIKTLHVKSEDVECT